MKIYELRLFFDCTDNKEKIEKEKRKLGLFLAITVTCPIFLQSPIRLFGTNPLLFPEIPDTMSYLSIIFDLDGTLLDTLTDLADTANEVLARHSFPQHSRNAYKQFVGDGLFVLMQRIVPAGTKEKVVQQCCDLFTDLYSKNWRRKSCPYDGIDDMLSALKSRGIVLAVLSNKPHEFTKHFIDEFFPGELFSAVYGQRNGFAKKPDPATALQIAKECSMRPRDMLFVGDSGVDIKTGKAAGMATAGVSWGFRSVQELTENNADVIVNSPLELEQYVVSSL